MMMLLFHKQHYMFLDHGLLFLPYDLMLYVIEATDKGIGTANEFILKKIRDAKVF